MATHNKPSGAECYARILLAEGIRACSPGKMRAATNKPVGRQLLSKLTEAESISIRRRSQLQRGSRLGRVEG